VGVVMEDDEVCTCGHEGSDHKSNGTCMVVGCLCGGFEEEGEE